MKELSKRDLARVEAFHRWLAKRGSSRATNQKSRFDEHFSAAADRLGIVLTGHLLAERSLRDLLDIHVHEPTLLEEARLSFTQLVRLSRALSAFPFTAWQTKALLALNTLRNHLAHNLSSASTTRRENDFIAVVAENWSRHKSYHDRMKVGAAISYLLGNLAFTVEAANEAHQRGIGRLLRNPSPVPRAERPRT